MLVLKSTLRIGLLTWVALASSIASKVAQSIGPDVIVGAIPGVANYPHVNGIDAFAVGTTSCNIGTAPLNWVSSTNDHPVIAQHAYRLDQGRFEMIGQSWLKHGFVALADSLCGTCQNPGTGSLLGVNCSDPYDASLNGSQNGLGPKFEVDAFTGIYPFPATNLNSSGNSIYKRLQIATTDLSPVLHPGAQFLIEAQYVSKDDAAAGNHFNNASWRSGSFNPTGNGYNLALNGPTMQQQPAIFGWKALDPGVRLKRIDVPAEGRFWLGVRASDNGDGTWDWNLALQNLNSHVSARSFSFTAPPGATLSNLGFHDVAYHSGEPWSGTDWTASVSSNTVTWQTQTFAQDPNANALRWGTTYSFRFTTDVAPTTLASSGSIGLFRPTPNPTVNFTLDPINTLVPLPNVDLKRNVFETFDPIVVRVESATGQPLSGIDVTFSVVGAGASIVGPSVVTSDANGLAQVVVQAGGLSGPVIIDAETTSASVQLTRFVRRFSFNWLPAAGILIFGVQTDEPGMYLTLAFDASSTPVMATPFGLVHTSVVNPGPNFSALSAIFGVGSFDPTLVTSIGGIWTRVFQNAHAFQGSGLDLAIQMYGYYQSPTGGTYWVSNAHQQLF